MDGVSPRKVQKCIADGDCLRFDTRGRAEPFSDWTPATDIFCISLTDANFFLCLFCAAGGGKPLIRIAISRHNFAALCIDGRQQRELLFRHLQNAEQAKGTTTTQFLLTQRNKKKTFRLPSPPQVESPGVVHFNRCACVCERCHRGGTGC